MVSKYGLFVHYYALFYDKNIDFVKDPVQLNKTKTSKRHHLVKCAMIYGCLSSTENQIPKYNNRQRL